MIFANFAILSITISDAFDIVDLIEMTRLVSAFVNKLAGVEDSRFKVGAVVFIIAVEILLVDHYRDKSASSGAGDSRFQLFEVYFVCVEV